MKHFQHNTAIVETKNIGPGTRIWAYTHILPAAQIGRDCNICDHVFVENEVSLGDRVTVKSGVQLWDGLTAEDDVFIGPNASFANDKYVRSRRRPAEWKQTILRKGSSVGANATILPGVEVGSYAMIGAGTVVTRNVPDFALVVGNPGRITGYVDRFGRPLEDCEWSVEAIENASQSRFSEQRRTLGVGESFYTTWPIHRDLRGSLVPIEVEESLPFPVRRLFFVFGVPSIHVRGSHSHRVCQQFMICVEGEISFALDDGKNRTSIRLRRPNEGIYVPPMVWATQYRHTENAKLLVLASHPYDDSDYIRDYEEYTESKKVFRDREAGNEEENHAP